MVVSVFAGTAGGEGGAGVRAAVGGMAVAASDVTGVVTGVDNLFFFGLPTVIKSLQLRGYLICN